MKPGDCYIDTYYEPETVVIQVVEYANSRNNFTGHVIYTSNSDILPRDITVKGYNYDKDLIPVAMITIDDKLMIIKL